MMHSIAGLDRAIIRPRRQACPENAAPSPASMKRPLMHAWASTIPAGIKRPLMHAWAGLMHSIAGLDRAIIGPRRQACPEDAAPSRPASNVR
jgi:hypothetical protein